jgi:signal peptidase I
MVGLPDERVSLAPPYLMVNGRKVTEPYAFKRLVEGTGRGYNGYVYPDDRVNAQTALGRSRPPLELGPTQYLPMGDNTKSSLDGRYFGPVDRQRIIGPAFVVYWPFTARWGRIQ